MSEMTNSKPHGGLFRVRYVNSREWSDVRLYVPVEHYQCGAVRIRYVNSREWSDVRLYVRVTTAICGARSGSPQLCVCVKGKAKACDTYHYEKVGSYHSG